MLPSSGYGSEVSRGYGEDVNQADNTPALRWTFEPNKLSVDACLLKAYEVMQANKVKNIKLNRDAKYVSGTTNSLAADIRCGEKEWVVIVSGYDRDAVTLLRDILRKAMELALT